MRTIFYFTGTKNKINFIHQERSFHGKNLIGNSKKKRFNDKMRDINLLGYHRWNILFSLVFSIRYTK